MNQTLKKQTEQLKALVLCAGKGTRLSPLTDQLAKPLIPIANQPMLFYVLDRIKEVGITDIGIVVSPGNLKQIRQAVGTGSTWNASIEYIVQEEAKGLAHAVLSAENYIGTSSFMLFLGDNLIGENLKPFVAKFFKGNSTASILLKEVIDPRAFGVAVLDSSGRVIQMEEKPREPKSNLAMLGIYLLRPDIFEAAKNIGPSRRGELEITDALQWILNNNKSIESYVIKSWWLDTGKREDLLLANRVILEEARKNDIHGKIDDESHLIGDISLGENSIIINSTITGPVAISNGCRINNSEIGPDISINTNSIVENSILKNDIILDSCHIHNIKLADSLIGTNTEIISLEKRKEVSGIVTGCNTKMVL